MNFRQRIGRPTGGAAKGAASTSSFSAARPSEAEPDRYQQIKKQLHRELKLYCVKSDVSVMDFVVSALQDKLSREGRVRQRPRSRAS